MSSSTRSPWINQFYCAITASLLPMNIGCVTGWPSASLNILKKEGLTQTQETWMVSLSMLGSCLGPTLFTFIIDRIGRKYSLLMADGIFVLSWIILAAGRSSPYALCSGRFIGGIANGYTINTVAIYITEIADVKHRQTLACMSGAFVSLGLLIQYGAGPWLSYEQIILVSSLPALVFLFLWFRLRESPYHLVAQRKMKEASNVLIWLRGSNQAIQEKVKQIEGLVGELKNNRGTKADLFFKRGPRKALLLSGLMFFIQPFSGVDVIASYMDQIFAQTTLSISHQLATFIIGFVNTCFALCEPFVVHRFGSKWTMIVCTSFCSAFLFTFGSYKYFDERHYDMSSVNFLPLACLTLFTIFCALGYSNIPWTISAELFLPAHKGFGSNLVTTMNCILAFVVTSLYGYLTSIIGASLYFMGSAIIFMLGNILVAIVLPNTKGRTFEKIQDMLER